jgi:hypothetical protein
MAAKLFLYVKQHKLTGLKYFGKHTGTDPLKYVGSGTYWMKHIKKHGKKHIETVNLWEFSTQEECTKFALKFSIDNNIVESTEWANLRDENGKDGILSGSTPWNKNKKMSADARNKMSIAKRGKPSWNSGKPESNVYINNPILKVQQSERMTIWWAQRKASASALAHGG